MIDSCINYFNPHNNVTKNAFRYILEFVMCDLEKNNINEENLEQSTIKEENTANQEQSISDQVIEKDQKIAELETALKAAKQSENEAMLRARAEIDNMRRRVNQDVEKAHKFALEKFSSALLPVIDNLERALLLTDKNNPELIATIEGIELTLKSFLDTVNKFGIEPIEEEGVPFNPDIHQAMSAIESPDVKPNHVLNVVQKGYILNGRLLRPAMVMVSKPKQE